MAVVFDEATRSYSDGVTTLELKDGAYEIGTLEQLKLFRDAVNEGNNFQGQTVKLTADIDLKNEEWTPIGTAANKFHGTFDGAGNTVSNLYINQPSKHDVGFFGCTQGGEIKNLTIENADVTGNQEVGAVAGSPFTSKYTNITLTGTVKVEGFAYVGGMLGKNAYADLTGLTVDAAAGSYVKAESGVYRSYVGGVVGFMGEGNITVKDVASNINVSGSTCDVGGIAGIAHYGNTFIDVTCSAQEVVLVNAQDPGDQFEVGGIAGVWYNQAGTTVQMINCKVENTELKSSLNGVEQDVSANTVTGKSYLAESGTSGSLLVGRNVTIDEATGKYTGGEFTVSGPDAMDVLNGKLADGMQAYPGSDGSLIVDEAGYVAAVGDVRYKSLAEALAAAQAGGTVTLLDDVALDATLEIARNVTLELAGFTVTGNVVVQGDADVTFRGGVMTAVSGNSVIDVKGSAVLNLDGMTVDGGNALNVRSSLHAVVYESVGGLHIIGSEILGGTLTHDENCGNIGSNSAAHAVYAYGSSGGSISIENSTLKGGSGKTDATYAGDFVAQWYVDGGIALQLGGNAAVEVKNSTIHGGNSDWRDAAEAINVSNSFDGTLSISDGSKVSGGNALNASGENRGIGGEGIYTHQSTGCTQIDIKDSEITGGDGGRSWNGSGIELNKNVPTNIENSTIASGQGANSSGNAGSISINSRVPEVDVTLKDVTLNGDGNGNDVIKGATDGIKIAGEITIAGGTLEDVTFSEVETGTVIKTTGTGAVDTTSVAGETSVPVFNEATGEYEFEFMDMTIFKVNAAWDGTAHGTEVVPGYRYGINAYASAADAFDNFTAETRNIELTGDQLLKTDFDDGGEWPKRNFDLALDGDLTLTAAGGVESTLTLTVVDSQNSGGGSTNEVGELAFYSASADQRATFTLEKGVTIDTNAKIWFGRPTQSSSLNTKPTDIVINGNIVQRVHDGRYYGILQIQTEKDSTVLVNGSVAFGWTLSVRGAVFTVSSTGEVKASDPASATSTILVDARSGVGGRFIVDGSKAVSAAVLDVDGLGSFEMKNEAAAAFDKVDLAKNATLLVADGSTLTADAVTNAGTIQITGENGRLAVAEGGLANQGIIVFGTSDKTVNTTFDVGMLSKTAGSGAFNFQNGEVTLTGVMADGIMIQPFNVGRNSENVALDAASAIVNIAAGAVVNTHQTYIAENTSANEHTLNVYGTLNAMTSIYNKQQGNLNIYGTVTANYMQGAGSVLVSGENAVLNLAGNGGNSLLMGRTGRTFRIADGGTVIAGGNVSVGYDEYSGVMEITGGGRLEAQTITVNNSSRLTLDHTASLAFGSITKMESATITVDLSGYTDRFTLLIENTGSDATDYAGLISNWNELEAAGCMVVGNDLFLGKADMSVFKVNTAWLGEMSLGEEVEAGFYYGVNAFGSVGELPTDLEGKTLEFAAGNTTAYGAVNFSKPVTITTYGEGYADFGGAAGATMIEFTASGKSTIAAGSRLTAASLTSSEKLTRGELSIAGEVILGKQDTEEARGLVGNLWHKSFVGSTLTIEQGGSLTVHGQILNRGTIVVKGELVRTVVYGGGTAGLAGVHTQSYAGKFIIDGGVVRTYASPKAPGGENSLASGVQIGANTGTSKSVFEMKNNGRMEVEGTLFLGANCVGTITDSTLKADAVENSGTVTVSGVSVLDIGTLTGEITLADGATLTDSTVGGTISAEGSASVAGTTSVDRLVLKGVRGENSELFIGADAVVTVKQLEVGTGLQKPDIVPGDTAAREYFSKVQVDGTLTVDRANQSGAIYIRPYAELVVTGTLNVKGEVHNRGSLVVDGGTMNVSGWETPKLLGYTTGDSLTVTNQGSLILTGVSAVTFGEAHASLAEMGVEAQYADGMFATISAGGKFEADTLAFRNDDDVTLTVTGEGSSFKLYSASGRTVTGMYNYAVNEGTIIVEDKASFDVSGLANAEFVNSGSITLSSASAKFATLTNDGTATVSDAVLTAGTVTNNGKFNVSGNTELNGTITGNALTFADGTVLTSKDGLVYDAGTVSNATLTFGKGEFNFKSGVYAGSLFNTSDTLTFAEGANVTTAGTLAAYGGMTIEAGASVKANNFYLNRSSVDVNIRGNIEDVDAAVSAYSLEVAGDGGMYVNSFSNRNLNITNAAVKCVYFLASKNASASINITDSVFEVTAWVKGADNDSAKLTWNVTGSRFVVAKNLTIDAPSFMNLSNSAVTAGGNVVNNGALVMDLSSTITVAGTFTSTGTITAKVDAAQSGVSFVKKLIGASAVTVNGNLTLEGGRDGAQLVVTDNALWLDNSDKSTILINSAYTGEVGSAIAGRDGYFFGFNALTAYDASIAADSAIEFTGGSYSFADGFAFTGHTFTVSGDVSFNKVIGGAVTVTGGTLSIGTVELSADVATLSGALLAFSGSGMADLANLVLTVSGTMANRTKYVLATGVKDDSFAITLNGETYELNVRKNGMLVGVENGELYVQKSDDWFNKAADSPLTTLPANGYAFGGSDMYQDSTRTERLKLEVATAGQNAGARVYGGGLLRNDALFSGTQRCEVTVTSGGVGKGVVGGNRIESGSIGGTLTSSVTIDSADGTFGFIVGGNQMAGGELNGFGSTSVTIENGTFSMWICGGSVAGGDAVAQVMGNTNVTITGGTFNGTGIFGGGFVQENGTLNQVGNTNVTISGGTFAGNIYGGHGATNKSASPNGVLSGNTNITISGGIFNGNIYGGGFDQSKVHGDTHITFTGTAGADFSVNGIIDGDASNARYWSKGSFVTGDRYLTFDAFSGEFGATLITNIDQMEVTGGSDVNLKNPLDLSEVSQWEFGFGSSLEGFAQNDLAGDTLVLSGWEDQLGDEGWTVMSGSSITGFGEMEVTNGSNLIFAWNADEQYYLGSIGDEQFKLSMEDGALKLAKLA